MDREKANDKLANHLMEQYSGKHDGRFRHAAALYQIETIVESAVSPFAKVRDIKIVLAALNKAGLLPDARLGTVNRLRD